MSWPDPWHLLLAYLVGSYVLVCGYWIFGFAVLAYRREPLLLAALWYIVPTMALAPLYLLATVVLTPWALRRRRGRR